MAYFALVAATFALVLSWRHLANLLISRGTRPQIAHTAGAFAGAAAAGLVLLVIILPARSNVYNSAWDGNREKVDKYLSGGGDIEALSRSGLSLLGYAAGGGHPGLVSHLLSEGADVNFTGRQGVSALHVAAREGHVDVVELLLSKGARVNVFAGSYQRSRAEEKSSFPYECTPFHWLIANRDTLEDRKGAMMEDMLRHGGNVNAFDENCSTPLFEAVIAKDLFSARWLLEHGAWISPSEHLSTGGDVILWAQNPFMPPFPAAVVSGNFAMVKLLLDHGADPNEKVNMKDGNHTIYNIAKSEDIRSLLISYGAEK